MLRCSRFQAALGPSASAAFAPVSWGILSLLVLAELALYHYQ
jgi:hypothetical protein